jgi:lipoprotein-anchoring transpeptidase ErfK/SrfK
MTRSPYLDSTCKLVLGASVGLVLALSSCVTKPQTGPPTQKVAGAGLYEWKGDGAKGPASVVVRLGEQKAYFYRGGKQVAWTYVATGIEGHRTPTGKFRVMEKKEDKISNLYGKLLDSNGDVVQSDFNLNKETLPEGCQFAPARMPFYMRLSDDGTGMHVGNIPHPGRPASHGCIRLPRAMAEKFFQNVEVGTPVTIIGG